MGREFDRILREAGCVGGEVWRACHKRVGARRTWRTFVARDASSAFDFVELHARRNDSEREPQSRRIPTLRIAWAADVSGGSDMKTVSAVLLAATMLAATAAAAHDFKIGELDIGHPWSRPTMKGATAAGGYLSITNKGAEPDRLIGATATGASRIEVPEIANVEGAMKSRPVADGLEIKPGKTIVFKPGSYRIVLIGLKQQLQTGDKVMGTLTFEKAGTVEIVYNVEANTAAAAPKPKGAESASAAPPTPPSSGGDPGAGKGGGHHHH
jgi:periplasmic copper chaperone A